VSQENSTSQFQGKTAIISGGAEGIGLSIAKALGEQQMNVVLADIDKDNLERARLELQSLGFQYWLYLWTWPMKGSGKQLPRRP
jgi:NADP-dependent 3-hydroxy acid dehydrogenase YdfG